MPVPENIALVRRWFGEVWNEGRVQTIYDLLDENVVGIGQDQPGVEIHGPADFVALFNRLHGAFPDIKITVDDTIAADDKVVARWSAVMTHTGDHLGIPATNRPVRVTGITIAQIKDGKIIRGWDNWDQFALMQQLSIARAAN
ncbi:MAG: ester cyclase [Candidatus Acidiferrales bacterium]